MTMTAMQQKNPSPSAPVLKAGDVLAVASGKGGVGKTWFSISLAQGLAHRGRRVLVFDGDLGLANVDVQLGLTPHADLGAVIGGQMSLEDAVSRFDGGAGSGRGFDVLAGRSGSGALSMLRREELVELAVGLKKTARHYDHVIIDLAAGIDAAVTSLSGLADLILVVATDEPTSLTDAYAFIKISLMRDRHAAIRVIINQAESTASGRRTYEALSNACRNFLKAEPALAGILPRDSKVRETIRRQSPILGTFPQSPVARAIETLCTEFVPD